MHLELQEWIVTKNYLMNKWKVKIMKRENTQNQKMKVTMDLMKSIKNEIGYILENQYLIHNNEEND